MVAMMMDVRACVVWLAIGAEECVDYESRLNLTKGQQQQPPRVIERTTKE
jgi:hypothetical protein